VEIAEDCIQMLLLLCCSVKEGDIPEKRKRILDPMLTSLSREKNLTT